MRNAAMGVLCFLLIALLAINARLRNREAVLDERIVALERQVKSKARRDVIITGESSGRTSQAPTDSSPVTGVSEGRPGTSSAKVLFTTPDPHVAVAELALSTVSDATSAGLQTGLENLEGRIVNSTPISKWVEQKGTSIYDPASSRMIVFSGPGGNDVYGLQVETPDDFGLTDTQKILWDSLRVSQDAETQVLRDKLKEIDERYQQAFRQMLDSEQLQKYDAHRAGTKQLSALWMKTE